MKALWSHHVQIATQLCQQCTARSTPTSIPIHTHSHYSTCRLSKNLPVLQNRPDSLPVKSKIKRTLIGLPPINKRPMNKISSSITCPQLSNLLDSKSKNVKPKNYLLKGSSFCSILEESLLVHPRSLKSQSIAVRINSLDKVSRNSFLSVIGVSKMYCPKDEMKIDA